MTVSALDGFAALEWGDLESGLLVGVLQQGRACHSPLPEGVQGKDLDGVVDRRGPVRDLVGTGMSGAFLISDRFVIALEAVCATGWDVVPVDIPGYDVTMHFLSVLGTCGPLTDDSGGPFDKFDTDASLFLDPTTWDGSDLFKAENYSAVLVRRQVADALNGYALTGAEWIRSRFRLLT